jgi:hypothetical protein
MSEDEWTIELFVSPDGQVGCDIYRGDVYVAMVKSIADVSFNIVKKSVERVSCVNDE